MDKKLLKKIYTESREMNKNVQTIRLFVIWMFLLSILKEGREQGDEQKAFLAKGGLGLAAVAQVLMIMLDIRAREK